MAGKKSKKKALTLIIAAVVLILLGVIYAVVQAGANRKQAEEQSSADAEKEAITLISVDEGDVTAFSFEGADKHMEVMKTEGSDDWGWTLMEYPELSMSKSRITGMLRRMTGLTARAIVDGTTKDAAKYGLDKPQYTFSFTTKDGSVYAGKIGDLNTYNNYYYLSLDGSDKIYMIDNSLTEQFERNIFYYSDEIGYPAVEDLTKIEAFDVKNDVMDAHFKKYPDGNSDVTWYGFAWFYESEGREYVSDPEATAAIQEHLSGLLTEDFIDYKCNATKLAEYGITEDSVTVSIHYETEGEGSELATNTYRLGDAIPKADGSDPTQYYCEVGDTGSVYAVPAVLLEHVFGAKLPDFYNKEFSLVSISTVEKIDLTIDGEHHIYTINTIPGEGNDANGKPNKDTYTYFDNGKEVEEKPFKDMYQRLIGVWGDRGITDEDELVDCEPYMDVIYYTNDPKWPEIHIELRSFNNNYFQATVNGDTMLLVNKNDLKLATDAVKNLPLKK